MTSKQDLRHNLWGPRHNEHVGSLVQKDPEFQDVTAEHETTWWALPSMVPCMTSHVTSPRSQSNFYFPSLQYTFSPLHSAYTNEKVKTRACQSGS